MNQRQENKFRANTALYSLFSENSEVIEKYPPLKSNVDLFNSKHLELTGLNVFKQTGTSGTTEAKKASKENLAIISSEVAACGYAFATQVNDQELISKFDYEYSDIRYGTDEDAGTIAGHIYDAANEYKEQLKSHLLDDEDLMELQNSLDEYVKYFGKQGSVSSMSVVNNQRIKILFKEIDLLLENVLDKQMLKIRRKDSLLVESYYKARNIKDLGSRKRNDSEVDSPTEDAVM